MLHFRVPNAFRDPGFRPERTCQLVFDRDVFLRVRDEKLGRVRGQPIRPVLAVPDSLVPEFWGATVWVRAG